MAVIPETEPDASLAAILGNRRHRILLIKIAVTLTLGILGGAILPVAWGFQETGMIYGFIIMVVVSFGNDFTCGLLLRQASVLNAHDYGSLSEAIGGYWYKIFTEISIVVLLLGSIISTVQQCGEAGAMGLEMFSSHMPHLFVARSGSILMALGVVFIVLPLCLYSKMHQLDKASFLGFILVWWLILVVTIESIQKGFPAIKSKEFKVVGTAKLSNISQATSIFGYCFFIQPMMMPFLSEVPSGKVGVNIVKWATRLFVLGLSFIMYGAIGFFGAARYGPIISDNILENKWMGGGIGQGFLNLSITFYLAISVPVLEFPVRQVLISWFVKDKRKRLQPIIISVSIMLFSLAISVAFPSNSGTVIVITGAIGVCIVAYLVPVVNHFRLIVKRWALETEPQVGDSYSAVNGRNVAIDIENHEENQRNRESTLPAASSNTGEERKIKVDRLTPSEIMSYSLRTKDTFVNELFALTWEYVLPILVVLVGFFCSAMSLYTL